MKTGYTFDAISMTLTVTADFAKKASQIGTLEYNTLLQFRCDYPTVNIVKRDSHNNVARTGIKFSQMEAFISHCRNAETLLAEYEKVRKLSKVQPSPYAFVKEWFMNNYANYSEQPKFDEEGFVIVKTKTEMEAEGKVDTKASTDATAA